MFWLGIFAALTFVLVYLFIVRPILIQQPVLSAAFKAEASLWDKLQAKVTGWRTKIAARLMSIAGIVVGAQTFAAASGVDITPFTSAIGNMVPERYRDLLVAALLLGAGWLFSWLRNVTEKAPQVITQKDDAGNVAVIGIMKPAA